MSQSIHIGLCQLVQSYYINASTADCNRSINKYKSLPVCPVLHQPHSYCWGNQSINTCKSLSVSSVFHKSDTKLLPRQSVNQYMTFTFNPVLHQSNTATPVAISQLIHVSHCQRVQNFFSQTYSYFWGNQSINTCKSLSGSPVFHQSDKQSLLRQSVNQHSVPKVRSSNFIHYNFWSKLYFYMKFLEDAYFSFKYMYSEFQ